MNNSKSLGFQHTTHFLQGACSNCLRIQLERSLGEVGSAARSIQVTFHAESSAPLQAEGLGWICFHLPDNQLPAHGSWGKLLTSSEWIKHVYLHEGLSSSFQVQIQWNLLLQCPQKGLIPLCLLVKWLLNVHLLEPLGAFSQRHLGLPNLFHLLEISARVEA